MHQDLDKITRADVLDTITMFFALVGCFFLAATAAAWWYHLWLAMQRTGALAIASILAAHVIYARACIARHYVNPSDNLSA